jgi:CBS domain-containing protein
MAKRVMTVHDDPGVVTVFEEENDGIERRGSLSVHHLPVVDGSGRRLITHHDCCGSAPARRGVAAARTEARRSTFARDLAGAGLVTVHPETPLVDAATRMRQTIMPVVDVRGAGRILTARDLDPPCGNRHRLRVASA